MHGPTSSRRRPGIPRMLGIGALGLIGGALLALFVQDLIASAFVNSGDVPLALHVVFAALIPIVAILTAVTAVFIDRRRAGRGSERQKKP